VNLRCKIFRAREAGELEEAINRFFAGAEAVELEEITQSESPAGVTVVVWYGLNEHADEILDDEPRGGFDEPYEDSRDKELA
jgi:hypothetical protein